MASPWTAGLVLLLILGTNAAREHRDEVGVQAGVQAAPLGLLLLRRPTLSRGAAAGAGAGLMGLVPVDTDTLAVGDTFRGDTFRADRADGDLGDAVFLRPNKRQVRYHRCYFNPISCFR